MFTRVTLREEQYQPEVQPHVLQAEGLDREYHRITSNKDDGVVGSKVDHDKLHTNIQELRVELDKLKARKHDIGGNLLSTLPPLSPFYRST